MVDSRQENQTKNPYRSPGGAADSRGKLGWLVMLIFLWPIVMAAVGSIIGFFLGRLQPEGVDPKVWNPGTGALAGAGALAMVGVAVGIRKALALRSRLDRIHARREELRHEVERLARQGDGAAGADADASGLATDGRAP